MKYGDRLEVLARTQNWARVRLPDGRTGWVEGKSLLDGQTYEAGRRLLDELNQIPTQATGHTGNVVNIHLEPSREAPQLAQLEVRQSVEVFGRRLVDRPAQGRASARPPKALPQASAGPTPGEPNRDAWYLVRAPSKAGWVLGRLVELDVPEEISEYAQGVNLVAWLVLNRVRDEGRQVPQYLIADRASTSEVDFNHIRVLTWALKHHRYATAYVESNLNGYFPIQVTQVTNMPHFRLRLVDAKGRKYQKVYGLFDTITRPLGAVEGWERNAETTRPEPRRRRRR